RFIFLILYPTILLTELLRNKYVTTVFQNFLVNTMGFCSGDNLSKVSEEKSCLPGAQTAAMPPVAIPPVAMRVPPLHPCGPSEDVSAALAFPTQAAVLSGSENFPSSLLHLFHDDVLNIVCVFYPLRWWSRWARQITYGAFLSAPIHLANGGVNDGCERALRPSRGRGTALQTHKKRIAPRCIVVLADAIRRRLVRGEPWPLHYRDHSGSDEHQKGLIHCNSGSKRLLDGASPAEEILPAKKIRLSTPEKSILKKTKFRRRFSTPRRTFFTDNATVLEYATSHPPCEISYLMRVQSNMSLCFDDGVWFKKTVYSSDESP
ncbi:hypothetical protein FHG87_014735, partial [Trinorchestia longiramus]